MAQSYYRLMEDTNPILERRSRVVREWQAAKANDPEYRQVDLKRKAAWFERNSQSQLLSQWLRRRTSTELEQFVWKTHVPVVLPQAVRKTCASCGASHRSGSKVWWRRLASAETAPKSPSEADQPGPQHETGVEIFDCHKCYTTDLRKALPLGHEDFVFGHRRFLKP